MSQRNYLPWRNWASEFVGGQWLEEYTPELLRELAIESASALRKAGRAEPWETTIMGGLTVSSGRARFTGDPKSAFLYEMAQVIATQGHHIKTCARSGCNRVFIVSRRGDFCSPRCSQLVRTFRHRTKQLARLRKISFKQAAAIRRRQQLEREARQLGLEVMDPAEAKRRQLEGDTGGKPVIITAEDLEQQAREIKRREQELRDHETSKRASDAFVRKMRRSQKSGGK